MTDAAALRALRWGTLAADLVFALITAAVSLRWHPLVSLDTHLVDATDGLVGDHPRVLWATRAFALVTHPNVVLGAAVIGGVVLWLQRQRRAALWVPGVIGLARLASIAAKEAVGRPRPPFANLSTHDSFPSGHATAAAAAATVVVILVSIFIRRRAPRRLATAGALVAALAVGIDRLLLGVHYPSDVVAGWTLGIFVVLTGYLLFDPRPRSTAAGAFPLARILSLDQEQLAVVVNPTKIDDLGQFRELVGGMAKAAGFGEIHWWETTAEDPGHAMAHEAAVSGASTVLAVGGDGTIRAVCEELAGTGISVGVVPAGTGNLFARNLEIPLYLRAAVDVALHGQDHAVDMVEVSGDGMEDATFLVMAGMGLDAAVMAGVNEDIKARVGWLAYVWSGLKAMMFPAVRVEISVDGGPFTRHRARTVVVGNVGYLQAGTPLIPLARLDDGLLDVVVLYPRRFWSWLPLAARLLTKSARTDALITRMSGRSVVVRCNTDAPRQLDGDPVAPGRELRATCVHGRLLVRVPR